MTYPESTPEQNPAILAHDVAVNQIGQEVRPLNAEGAEHFVALMQIRLSEMNNIHRASAAQSLDAMEGAALGIDMVAEAITNDPEALDAIGKYRGPLSEMASAAGNTHTHQTGHRHPETYFSDSSNMDAKQAIVLLGNIKQKMLDRQRDGTSQPSGDADALTAHARKTTAIAAINALKAIADTRGQAIMSAETIGKMGAFISKSGPRY